MSGGAFEYNQWKIEQIAREIESIIYKNGKEKSQEELRSSIGYGYDDPEYLEKYPDERYHYQYPEEVIKHFKTAVIKLREAAVYAQRIDWLLSGDDGEDTFLERLESDLELLKNKKIM